MHLSQRVLGVPIAGRCCELQPLLRTFVILDDANTFAQRVPELVLRLRAAVLGRTLQPRLRLLLVACNAGAMGVHLREFVFCDGVIARRARESVGKASCIYSRIAARLFRRADHIPGDDPRHDCKDRQARDIVGASADNPEALAAIAAAIRGAKSRLR